MDTIFVNDLLIHTIIGKADWERSIKQSVILNICITTDFSLAAKTEDINLTIDHDWLVNNIIDFVSNTNFKLLVALVVSIEQLILTKYKHIVFALEITAKRSFILSNTKEVGVKIARTYARSQKT